MADLQSADLLFDAGHSPIGVSRLLSSRIDDGSNESQLSFLEADVEYHAEDDIPSANLLASLARTRARSAVRGAPSGWFGQSAKEYASQSTPQPRLVPSPPKYVSTGFGDVVHRQHGRSSDAVSVSSDDIPAPTTVKKVKKKKKRGKKAIRRKAQRNITSIPSPRPDPTALTTSLILRSNNRLRCAVSDEIAISSRAFSPDRHGCGVCASRALNYK